MRWSDAADIGSPGFGLLDELERRGLDVAADEYFRVQVTDHRTRPRSDNVAQIHLATGGYVERWRAVPDAVEVATYDPRTDAQQAPSTPRSGTQFVERLAAEGLDELVPLVDTNLFGISADVRLSAADQADLATLIELGQPMAVFIAPPPADDDPARCERSVDLKERPPGEDVRRHPWEVARARSFRRLDRRPRRRRRRARRVLDIGAGDGWFASDIRRDLPPAASIVCWDVNYRSEDLATPAGPGIVRTAAPPGRPVRRRARARRARARRRRRAVPRRRDRAGAGAGRRRLAQRPGPPAAVLGPRPDARARAGATDRREFRALVARHLDVVAAGSLFATLVPLRAVDVGPERLGRGGEQRGVGAWQAGPVVTRRRHRACSPPTPPSGAGTAAAGCRCPGCRRGPWPRRHGR